MSMEVIDGHIPDSRLPDDLLAVKVMRELSAYALIQTKHASPEVSGIVATHVEIEDDMFGYALALSGVKQIDDNHILHGSLYHVNRNLATVIPPTQSFTLSEMLVRPKSTDREQEIADVSVAEATLGHLDRQSLLITKAILGKAALVALTKDERWIRNNQIVMDILFDSAIPSLARLFPTPQQTESIASQIPLDHPCESLEFQAALYRRMHQESSHPIYLQYDVEGELHVVAIGGKEGKDPDHITHIVTGEQERIVEYDPALASDSSSNDIASFPSAEILVSIVDNGDVIPKNLFDGYLAEVTEPLQVKSNHTSIEYV